MAELMTPELEGKLKTCRSLPSPPSYALQVIELVNDPEVDIDHAVKVFALDPVIVSKILRIANSPPYANQRKVESLQMAIVLLGLPATTSLAFSSKRFDPFLIGLFSHSITERLELGYNVGVVWSSEAVSGPKSRETFPAFKYTLSTGWRLNDHLGMFTEFFGEIPEDRFAAHSFDAGLTYSVVPNVQLDMEAGIGLNRAASDYFLGTGLVVRFPR